jgi:CRISPR-associated protein Csb2
MLTLRLTFPWGRYYAHPWGQNPARITEAEWPPSPWRLLRAIAAAWYQVNSGKEPSDELIQTLEILGRELPTFRLPKVSFSRAIHYQPNFGATAKADVALAKYKRVRHENHFAAVGGDVLIQWKLEGVDVAFLETVRSVVYNVVDRITYFGRAESICEVSIEDEPPENLREVRVTMQQDQPCRQISSDCRDVLCPNPNNFIASDLWKRRDCEGPGGLARKHLVQDLIDAFQPLPDGAAWYSYHMPEGWPQQWLVRHSTAPVRKPKRNRVIAHFLEFLLQCRIPVPVKHIVSIAERFREAAIRNHGQPSFALSGHDRPEEVVGNHKHAFYLPIPGQEGDYLESLRIWCQHGFTQDEVNALMSVEALRWAGGRFPVRPVLLHMARDIPPIGPAKRWQSITPFVPPRFWYRKKIHEGRVRDSDSPELQISRCLRDNGLTFDCNVSRLNRPQSSVWDLCKVHLPKSVRQTKSEPDHRVGVFLQLDFSKPVVLLLPAFGHSAHFGLGQFTTVE